MRSMSRAMARKTVSVSSESESVGMHVGLVGGPVRESRPFRFVCLCLSHPLLRQDRTARRTRVWSAINVDGLYGGTGKKALTLCGPGRAHEWYGFPGRA